MKFILLFFYSLSTYATDWKYSVGNKPQMKRVLEANLGVNKVFNCDITIEKIVLNDFDYYFVSAYDRFLDKYVVMNFKFVPDPVNEDIGMIRLSHSDQSYVRSLRLFSDRTDNIYEFIYNELDYETMTFVSTIQCQR